MTHEGVVLGVFVALFGGLLVLAIYEAWKGKP